MTAEILEQVLLPNGTTVALYDWMAEEVKDGRNLIARDRNGVEAWKAKPMLSSDPGADCFVAIRAEGMTLTASTWSGYEVAIDPDNGSVTTTKFTK